MGLFLIIFFMIFFLWIGFYLTGALLRACVWLFILVPLTIVIWVLALVCCCTIILIPIGIHLFKVGLDILIPSI